MDSVGLDRQDTRVFRLKRRGALMSHPKPSRPDEKSHAGELVGGGAFLSVDPEARVRESLNYPCFHFDLYTISGTPTRAQ